jgi:lysophospholipase L1-like esterase
MVRAHQDKHLMLLSLQMEVLDIQQLLQFQESPLIKLQLTMALLELQSNGCNHYKDNKAYLTDDGHQVPLEDYEKNLTQLVTAFKASGATVVWCSTTPVPVGKVDPPRQPEDVVKYNEVARRVMTKHGVAIDDLYAAALPRLSEILLPHNVHYTKEGYVELAKQVAASIEEALNKRGAR